MGTKAEIININFSAATKQADKLDSIAERMEQAMASLGNEMNNLGGYWQGDASNDYRKQGDDVKELLRKNIANIRTVASGIRKTANTYRQMENQKLEAEKEEK